MNHKRLPFVGRRLEVVGWCRARSFALLAPAASEPLPELGYGWALLQMLVALLVVCALAYVVLRFVLRRLAAPRLAGDQQLLRVLERCPLSSGRALWLVKAGGRYLVVGEGEGGICRVAELEACEVEEVAREAPPRRSFLEVLKRSAGGEGQG